MANTPATYYLGIDTGGTFTDGVLFDPITCRVIKTVKARTTHQDLKVCIAEVFDQLLNDRVSIGLVSLSTTLATNAIVEGKRRPVALLLLGYDPELVRQFGFQEQFGSPDFFYVGGLHGLDGVEREPLDESGVLEAARRVQGRVDAYAVCAYGGPVNAGHEERAAQLLRDATGLPVVEAHHLSSELNSIWRATTVSLNASLLGATQDFIAAVTTMLAARGIECPVMIVRGDGSLAQAAFARHRPVEIVHSGPATSAVGGYFLARERVATLTGKAARALVVDMGGTTTDLAVIEHGCPLIHEKAATVGSFQTCVHTIRARSFGLGGDSRILFDHWGRLEIGPERALPLSYLCQIHPQLRPVLKAALSSRRLLYSENLEFWMLRRLPERPLDGDLEQRIVGLLSDGPMIYSELRRRVGIIPPFTLRALIEQEVLERAALTPTDLLHVTGEFAPWYAPAAEAVIAAAAKFWGEKPVEFVCRARALMTRRIVREIVQFLSRETLPDPARTGFYEKERGLANWLFNEALVQDDVYLGSKVFLKIPLVGIGAPARAFLPPAAEALGTELVLPEHYEVANAIGAVVGRVIYQAQGEVLPCMEGAAVVGYFARVASSQKLFTRFGDAVQATRARLRAYVIDQAIAAGAHDPIVELLETPIWDGMLKLTATAIGT